MAYELIWSDEFLGTSIDKDKWNIEVGGHGFGNAELQYYTPEETNCKVVDKMLSIEARKEDYEQMKYTSSKLTTFGKFSFKYGKVLVRAKLPKGMGSWPAIWMLPDSFHEGKTWPLCGEIDMMEHVGRNEDVIHFSLHTGEYNHNRKSQYTYFNKFEGITDRFADYEMVWTDESISFCIDGTEYAKFNKGEHQKRTDEKGWPFDQPFYLIINYAVGGYWGGEVDDRIFPSKFEIDFVKIYQEV